MILLLVLLLPTLLVACGIWRSLVTQRRAWQREQARRQDLLMQVDLDTWSDLSPDYAALRAVPRPRLTWGALLDWGMRWCVWCAAAVLLWMALDMGGWFLPSKPSWQSRDAPVPVPDVYYASPSGSDSNDCVAAQNIHTPKRTLAGVLPCDVHGGATIYLRGGTYTETIVPQAHEVPIGYYATTSIPLLTHELNALKSHAFTESGPTIASVPSLYMAGQRCLVSADVSFTSLSQGGALRLWYSVGTVSYGRDFLDTADVVLPIVRGQWHQHIVESFPCPVFPLRVRVYLDEDASLSPMGNTLTLTPPSLQPPH